MSKEDNNNVVSFIKGVALGAAVGAAIGVLFAPKSGKETRQDISDAASKAKEKVEASLKKTYSDLGELADKASIKASELKGKAKTELEKLSEQARNAQAKVRETISSVREGDIVKDKDVDKALKEAQNLLDEISKSLKDTK